MAAATWCPGGGAFGGENRSRRPDRHKVAGVSGARLRVRDRREFVHKRAQLVNIVLIAWPDLDNPGNPSCNGQHMIIAAFFLIGRIRSPLVPQNQSPRGPSPPPPTIGVCPPSPACQGTPHTCCPAPDLLPTPQPPLAGLAAPAAEPLGAEPQRDPCPEDKENPGQHLAIAQRFATRHWKPPGVGGGKTGSVLARRCLVQTWFGWFRTSVGLS